MIRGIPKDNTNWGVETNVIGEDGKPVYGANGKILKQKVRMADGRFANGFPQCFYFPPGHEHAGKFKGMMVILEERNLIPQGSKLKAECKNFKCQPGATDCCCRRILYNQPDFVNVESLLEQAVKACSFGLLFLPKFHCEFNPIEQCWGYAKRVYRLYPPFSKEADLENNVISALDSVPLTSIRRFARRSQRFINAYQHGLDGQRAAWATKKFRGHCIVPESIFQLFDDEKKAGRVK